MAPPPIAHPTDPTLHAYGRRALDEASTRAIRAHLESCPECRRRAGARAAVEGLPPELVDHPQYTVIRALGQGGMGVVYLARNTLLDRLEVLKVLNKDMLDKRGVAARFLREIQSAAKLNHPNVVGAFAALPLGRLLVFAMEYVEGDDLARIVKARGPLPVPHACYFIYQAALGLQHAYARGLVHRDIKPGNLVLAQEGRTAVVKILDFGLAKAQREDRVDSSLTQEGQMLGTPDYMAPEQIANAQQADIRADIYSLGGTLYYLLTGGPPFRAASLYDLLQAHHSIDAKPLNFVRPEVPAELATIVGKMMAKDPGRRYQTPSEVAQTLLPFFKKGAPKLSGSGLYPTQADTPEPVRATPTPPPLPPEPATIATTRASSSSLGSYWKTLIETRKPGPAPAEAPAPRRPAVPIVAAVAVGVLLVGFVLAWAAGVFRGTIPDGSPPRDLLARADELNPWPKALALGGQTFDQGLILAVSRDGRRVAQRAPGARPLRVFEGPDGRNEVALESSQGAWAAEFSPDGKRLAACYWNEPRVSLWDAETGQLLHSLPGHAYCLAFRADGKRLATGGKDKVVRVWDVATGESAATLAGHSDFLWSVAWAPDGSRLASGGGAWYEQKEGPGVGELKVWDLASGIGTSLDGHPMRVAGVAFSPDGTRLASASFDKTVKVWDLATRQALVTFDRHQAFAGLVAFSPDGALIASGGRVIPVRVWEAATGREVASLVGLPGNPGLLRFSRHGRWIYAATESTLKVWEAPPRPDADRPSDGAAFRPLFKGTELVGWLAYDRVGLIDQDRAWSVRDGVLHGAGTSSHLFSPRGDYRDVRVRAEVKINDGGNSGLYVRAARGPGFPKGYEAQINATHRDPNKTGSLYGASEPPITVAPSPVPPDTWFTLEVEAVGDRIAIRVDGKPVVHWTDPRSTYSRGHVALEVHDPLTHVQIRRLEIMELDPSGRPETVAGGSRAGVATHSP